MVHQVVNAPRFRDWQLRLEAFAAARQSTPFQWGTNDCVLFAADAVEALTGVHHCAELRWHESAREAVESMRYLGGVRAIASLALGEPVSPAYAAVGDVVAVKVGKREALGICNGNSVMGPGPAGIVSVGMDRALAAWKVG